VVTEDFRRSSNRPTIMNVPAKSKVELITLIQLVGTEGKYTTTFIVNEVAPAIEVDKSETRLDVRLDDALKDQKATIFVSNDCSICKEAKRILGENNIAFTEYNIDDNAAEYLEAVETFQTDKKPIKTTLPLLKIKDQFYKNINSIEDFNGILRKVFN